MRTQSKHRPAVKYGDRQVIYNIRGNHRRRVESEPSFSGEALEIAVADMSAKYGDPDEVLIVPVVVTEPPHNAHMIMAYWPMPAKVNQ